MLNIQEFNNEGERMFDFENGDINIMLSMINMKLRDEFSSLESFANYYSLSKEEIIKRLEEKGYQYNENENQFRNACKWEKYNRKTSFKKDKL